MFGILKAIVILGTVFIMAVLFVVSNMTNSDFFVSIAVLIPTAWCVLLVSESHYYPDIFLVSCKSANKSKILTYPHVCTKTKDK